MRKRLWVTLPLCLLAGAAFAAVSVGSAAGGTARATINPVLNLASAGTDVDHIDPALAYGTESWQIEQETCDTLVGYSDASGKPSASVSGLASGLPVISNGGKKYVFTVKSGLKFSNGDSITAANFKYAFDRNLNPAMASPVVAFTDGVVKTVSASGMKLTITLAKADGTFLAKLAMPFWCPLTKNSPMWTGSKWKTDEVSGTSGLPGNGPYYLFDRSIGSQIVLKKNPHYKGVKKSTASTIVINMKLSQDTSYNGIENGTYASDVNGNPGPANNKTLFNKYGKNKSRFWVEPTLSVSYLVMNQARPTFTASHVKLRQAVNQVINRPGIIAIAGYLSGSAQTQALPKPLAGSHFSAAYKYPITAPNSSRYKSAKTLGGNCAGGKTVNFWHGSTDTAKAVASLNSFALKQLGCKVNDFPFAGFARYVEAGKKGNSMDIMSAGWNADYADGFDWFGILFDGRTIVSENNNDLAYMNNHTLNTKIDSCNKLVGSARTNCWGSLDQWMTSSIAPWATIYAGNFVDYISGNAHNYKYNGAFASADLGLLYQS